MSQDDKEKAESECDSILEEGKNMLYLLQSIKLKTESNYKSKFFTYLDKSSISKIILPYLGIQDLKNLRLTCRLMNETVTSLTNFFLFKKRLEKENKKSKEKQEINMDILKIDTKAETKEDLQEKLKSLNDARKLLLTKLYQSENMIKACKYDIDLLKTENKNLEQVGDSLRSDLEKARNENEVKGKENLVLKQELDEIKRKYEESQKENSKIISELRNQVESMNIDKKKLTSAVIQLKNATDELKKKNASKAEALKAIKNFFMNSTLLNLKNIPEFSQETKIQQSNK